MKAFLATFCGFFLLLLCRAQTNIKIDSHYLPNEDKTLQLYGIVNGNSQEDANECTKNNGVLATLDTTELKDAVKQYLQSISSEQGKFPMNNAG